MSERDRTLSTLDDSMFAEYLETVGKASEGIAEEIARSLDGFEPDAISFEPPALLNETEVADQINREIAAIPDDFADECTMSYQLFEEDAASFDILL